MELGFMVKNSQEQFRWDNLSDPQKKVHSTHFVPMNVLAQLGLDDIMRQFFQRSGMLDFLEKNDYTYRCLVLEFLTTIEFKNDKFRF